jgi:putative hydrolase of the HAD superfamily
VAPNDPRKSIQEITNLERPVLSTNTIRAIFFDAVGTLIHPQPSASAVYAEVGQRFGSRLTAAAISARFRAAFQHQEDYDRGHGYRTDHEREVSRWRTIVAEVLDDVTDAEACFQALFQHFAQPQSWRVEPDTEAVLRELSKRSYRLGLASNFDRRLHEVVAGLAALRYIGHQVISADVGFRKPGPRFFQKVCEVADLPSSRILVVGDDLINDYEGARSAGVSAVLFDPRGLHSGRLRLSALRDLIKLLDGEISP